MTQPQTSPQPPYGGSYHAAPDRGAPRSRQYDRPSYGYEQSAYPPYGQPGDPAARGYQAAGQHGPQRLPLMRPQRQRMLCGVCRGLSLHLGVSVWTIRLLFILTAFVYGAGIVAYVFLWMLVPAGDPVAAARTMALSNAQAPLSRGNAPYAAMPGDRFDDPSLGNAGGQPGAPAAGMNESIAETLRHTPKPALFALAGVLLIVFGLTLRSHGISVDMIVPLVLAACGIGVSWLRFNAKDGQLWTMIGGVALIFGAYALYMSTTWRIWHSTLQILLPALALLAGVGLAIVPWIISLVRDLGTERALKEREEERADMTAHLHDGVLQTLALIQLHSDDPSMVFTLARQQERELREWLYQERTTSDRSVSAGLKDIAARVEDEHGKPIEVVTVGDARPSAQTDALLDATQQALINAVTHGGEPISVYCEAKQSQIEVFVRDHGDGFDVDAIPEGRLGIRESIIGRIHRRGGTVEIVSRPQWGTEVRMHMPIAEERAERSGDRAPNRTSDHATVAGDAAAGDNTEGSTHGGIRSEERI